MFTTKFELNPLPSDGCFGNSPLRSDGQHSGPPPFSGHLYEFNNQNVLLGVMGYTGAHV